MRDAGVQCHFLSDGIGFIRNMFHVKWEQPHPKTTKTTALSLSGGVWISSALCYAAGCDDLMCGAAACEREYNSSELDRTFSKRHRSLLKERKNDRLFRRAQWWSVPSQRSVVYARHLSVICEIILSVICETSIAYMRDIHLCEISTIGCWLGWLETRLVQNTMNYNNKAITKYINQAINNNN